MKLRFTKMQGAGNDFVLLDATQAPIPLSGAQLRQLADRRFGVGADQVLLIEPSPAPGIDFGYRIFNGASGEEVEHCGNGARCVVRYVHAKGLSTRRLLRVQTLNATLTLQLLDDERVTVDMNAPIFELDRVPFDATGLRPREVNGFAVWPIDLAGHTVELAVLSMGNPHAVQWVDDVDAAPVASNGPLIERHPRFLRSVNAGFAQIVDRRHIRLRVYERGAGETLACGTGACASVVAGIRLGLLDDAVDVEARGGRLSIAWPSGSRSVSMTGPAQTVYDGEIDL